MIEAVGWEWFDAYFRRCSRLLAPGRAVLPAGDRRRRRRLRDREAHPELRQPGDLPGRLPALGRVDPALDRRRDRPADASPSRTSPPATCSPCAPGASASRPRPSGSRSSATTSASGAPGASTWRSARPGFAETPDPRRPDAVRQAALERARSAAGSVADADRLPRAALQHDVEFDLGDESLRWPETRRGARRRALIGRGALADRALAARRRVAVALVASRRRRGAGRPGAGSQSALPASTEPGAARRAAPDRGLRRHRAAPAAACG